MRKLKLKKTTSAFSVVHVLIISIVLNSCTEPKPDYQKFSDYPTATDADLWVNYSATGTEFKLWSPTADSVRIKLYVNGNGGLPDRTVQMNRENNGLWKKKLAGDLNGTYYTYQVMVERNWLNETPGIYAQAVGVDGNRAMVLNFDQTNPVDWDKDKGPDISFTNEAIIYELHIRDMTIQPESGSSMPGKYLGLVEAGTTGPQGVATGLDHLIEMGITHVHLLPAFDHYAIQETKLDSPQFNWGYDPQNYNVPEGSFSSDPFNAETRVKEFKQMVKTFHDNGIGVILDVVYNHTGRTAESNFNREVPGYYYRHWEDGKLSDAASCGNETASERAMMRKFILESVVYWAEEYHVDGFRFDLMGIHDMTTMNEVATDLKKVNANIFIYGEGWTAGDSPLPVERRSLKKNTLHMSQITAFSDDVRDGLKGSVFVDESTGFVSGAQDTQESVKFGIVGSIMHPAINYDAVNYSKGPWANEPWQAISYVSCHDNHTLYDKLKVSRKDASQDELIAMDKLANAVVLTSQGAAFLHAGVEMLRTKNGEHNSYNLPDAINRMDWNGKVTNASVVEYYKNLIGFRKAHPAFRMTRAEDVRANLEFKRAESKLISYQISNHANNDLWENILVVYNAKNEVVDYDLEGNWELAVEGNTFGGGRRVSGSVKVPALSMLVAFQK